MSENTKMKVVFFFPWNEISGGPLFLSSLARALANDNHYDVYYTDYEPGLTDKLFDHKKVSKIVYSEPFDFPIKEPVTLIVPIYCSSHIPVLHPDSKILYLNWHNYCIQSLIDIWHVNDTELQTFLSMVHDTDSVFFLDRAHWQAQNEWVKPEGAYEFNEQYVPITVKKKTYKCRKKLIDENEINIACLGRLCRDKIYSLLDLIHNMEALKTKKIKNIYVIGDGPDRSMIKEKYKNGVIIHMMGTITGDKLYKFLANKVDALFAMGTSVLEGASLGLPSVIIPHNIHAFKKNAYVYIQDTKGFAMGWYDTQVEDMDVKWYPLRNIIEDLYDNSLKEEIGNKAFQYVENNHFENVEYLKKALSNTSLEYKRFAEFAKRQGYKRVMGLPLLKTSSTMDETERWVSLFGSNKFLQFRMTPRGDGFYLFGKRINWLITIKRNDTYTIYINITIPIFKLNVNKL